MNFSNIPDEAPVLTPQDFREAREAIRRLRKDVIVANHHDAVVRVPLSAEEMDAEVVEVDCTIHSGYEGQLPLTPARQPEGT